MHPDAPLQTISCRFIECPDPFIHSLHEGPADASLADSLQQYGQTAPLLVWQHTNKQYQLLAGYSTFQAITSLGIGQAVCRVLPQSTPPVQRYALQILYGLAASQSSPILHAYLLEQARQQLADNELLPLLSLMGYKPQRYKLAELTALLCLAPSAVLALHRGILSPKAGKLCGLLPREDQETLVRLINAYRPGGSKQLKLVEMVTELSLRDNKPVLELVREWLPADQEGGPDNAPQRLHGCLQSLSALYSPEKTKMEKRFQQLVHALHLPEGVTLAPSPSFEDESVELRLRFATSEALRKKWEQIKTVIQQ